MDDYELTPHKRLKELEMQVEKLKTRKLTPEEKAHSEELLENMQALEESIKGLVEIFSSATQTMALEDKEEDVVEKTIQPIMKKIDMVIDQNQKIAKGIVAVADMVTEEIPKLRDEVRRLSFMRPMPRSSFAPKPSSKPMSHSPMPGPMHAPGPAPSLGPKMPVPAMEKTPPPGLAELSGGPAEKKKGGFGGLFKK
ncbi:hypothetical protein KY330_02525 [Candidatus Woesearchaeota archaeon]|nr:hypothetical protein [Candidatus Woesearchaeota archaeon]